MADEVLGISGQIDISDIQENMKELINLLDKVGIKTDEISKTFAEKMNKIQSSSSDSASKQKQAMEVFADSVEMAKSKLGELPAKLQDSLSTIESLDKKCQNLHSSMQDMKINSDEFTNANKELQSTRKSLDEVSENADEMAKRINEASKDSVGSLSRIDNSSQNLSFSIAKLIGMLGGTYALKNLYNQMVAIRSQFQAADVAIQTMLGNKEKADALLMQVREYAKISPLEFGDITAATKMMVGFNIEAEKVPRYIQAIGDISMGNKQNFNSLTLAFSQMSATGKLMGQDLLQMINAGFNPLTEMANQTGKSVSQLKEEMSKGAISAEMVQEAFIKATSEGGKFFQMSEKGSQTIQGQLSMMQDAIDAAFNEVGQKTEGIIMTSIQTTTKLIENYDKIGRILEGLVVTYGAYRTAVALTTFAESGHTITMTLLRARILLTQRAQALLNATMLANPYVLAATAIGALIGTYISLGAWTSSTENAQKTFNEQIEKGKEEMDKYNRETEEAIKLAENDKDATGERRKALNLLIERYPSIIKKYIDEKGHLKDILNLKREIAEIDGKKKVDSYQDKSKEYADWANLAKNGTDVQKRQARAEYLRLTGKSGMFSTTEDAYEYFSTLSKSYTNQANKENAKNSVEKFQNTIANWNKSQLNKLAKALERGKNSGKNYVRFSNYKDLKNADISQNDINTLSVYVEGLLNSKDSAVTKTTLEERKKKLQSELDALSKEEAAGKKGQELRSKIRKIDEELKPYSASYDDKNRNQLNKDNKQAEELLKMQRKERLDAEKQHLVAKQAIREADIAAEKNDAVREIKMLEDAHQKRMEQIQQQKKDMLENNIQKAASEYQKKHENDKGYKSFFTQGLDKEVKLTKDQISLIEAETKKANEERDRSIREYDEKAISSHQSYIDKRLAIDKQYSEEVQKYYTLIENAKTRKDNDAVEKLERSLTELQKSYAKSRMNLAFEELKKSPDFSVAFDDLTNTGTATIEALIKRFQEARGIAGQNLGIEDMKEYISVINKMTEELISRNPAKVIEEQSQKLSEYEKELESAKNILDFIRNGEKVIKSFVTVNENGVEKIVPIYWDLADAEENVASKAQLVSNAQNNLQKTFKAIISDINGLISSFDSLGNAIGGSAGGIISAIGSIGSDMTSFMSIVSELPNAKGNFLKTASSYISLAGTVISIGTKISGLFDSISPSYEKAAEKQKEINNLRRAVESYRLAVIKAKNEENSWFDTTGLQSLKNAYIENGEIAKQYYAQLYEAQEKYQNKKAGLSGVMPYITAIGGIALGAVTGGLGALAVGAAAGAGLIGSVAAATIIGAAVDGVAGYIIGKGSEAALNAITYKDGQTAAVNNLRVQTQHKTWFRSEKTKDLRDWVREQYGEELFDEKGLINLEIAKAVLDSDTKLVGETRETLEKLVELREEYDKFREQLRDYVSQTYSPIADSMTDAIWDWLKDGVNVMDKFKEYASNTFADIAKEMVKQMILTKIFDGIENQLTDIYEDYASGGIDETALLNQVSTVIDKLVGNYEQNIPALQDLMTLIDRKFSELGFDITGEEYSQSATAKAVSNITYDQANVIDGRLTAIQINAEQQLTELQVHSKLQERMAVSLDEISMPIRDIDANIETMVGIQTSMNEHLEAISANTKCLPAMAADINKMKKKMENM